MAQVIALIHMILKKTPIQLESSAIKRKVYKLVIWWFGGLL